MRRSLSAGLTGCLLCGAVCGHRGAESSQEKNICNKEIKKCTIVITR
ncbi:hypothetical protein CUS_4942 [Ruminococcus albus 8]|uniref:Uncharacterized protein n=1 Tax=Ruminococcus albus 8 TaxID=246199 RepID=E9S7L7_RUMAL|nr:hypothetical protein CUS_4942 [Ruminococcus albus 8]